jgi:hypothetical protein
MKNPPTPSRSTTPTGRANLVIALLALLAIAELGLIVAFGRPAVDVRARAIEPAASAQNQHESQTSSLPSVPLPSSREGGTNPASPAAGSSGPDQTANVTAPDAASELAGILPSDSQTVRDFYFTPDFEQAVRKLKAAGADEVLLAHAVVSQYHRQTEALRWEGLREKFAEKYGEEWRDVAVAEMQDKAREQIVGDLIGVSAFKRWQVDTELAQLGYGGQPLTVEEAGKLSVLDRLYTAKLMGYGDGVAKKGVKREPPTGQQLALVAAEYRQKRVEILGPARAAAIR